MNSADWVNKGNWCTKKWLAQRSQSRSVLEPRLASRSPDFPSSSLSTGSCYCSYCNMENQPSFLVKCRRKEDEIRDKLSDLMKRDKNKEKFYHYKSCVYVETKIDIFLFVGLLVFEVLFYYSNCNFVFVSRCSKVGRMIQI